MPFELTRCGGQPHGRQADTWWDWGCTDRVREPRTPAQVDLGTGQHPGGTEGQTQGTSWLPETALRAKDSGKERYWLIKGLNKIR